METPSVAASDVPAASGDVDYYTEALKVIPIVKTLF